MVLHGSPFACIVSAARDRGVDLIVMGSHGRTGLPHILLGSVAERVVRLAPCPVLVTRPPAPAAS
jgi:nucleotide-binding universal stress UspA family protein